MTLLGLLKTMLRRGGERAPDVDARAAADLRAQGAVVLDVREPWERARSRIPGSLHIPLDEVEARAGEIPTDRPVVAHCAAGARSAKAAAILREKGVDARNLAGGIWAWKRAKLPVEETREDAR